MKKIFLVLCLVLAATTVQAAPFLTSDPQTGVTSYTLTGPAWVPASVTAQANGSLRLDVAPSAVGSTSLTVKACNVDPVWGTQCSASVPFVYTRPVVPAIPGGLGLVQ